MTIDQRARKVREDLFARYDQLNALWEKGEEELSKVHVPRGSWYAYDEYDADWRQPGQWIIAKCLGLQKIKGKWRICHATYDIQSDPEPENWTPITECSAEVRVEAAKHFAAFRQAVIESAEQFVPKVDAAIELLKSTLAESNMADLLAERAKLNGKAK